MKRSVVTVAPSVEPVTLTEAKTQLRIISSDSTYDTEVNSLITAARQWVEKRYGIAFITQTREQRQDNFYETYGYWRAYSQGYYYAYNNRFKLDMLYGPVQDILTVQYVASDGTLSTLAYSTDYDKVGLITPVSGGIQDVPIAAIYPVNSWPTFKWIPEAIRITYRCGFGDSAIHVPAPIKQAILRVLGSMFDNRMDETFSPDRIAQMEFNVDRIMSTYAVYQHANILA